MAACIQRFGALRRNEFIATWEPLIGLPNARTLANYSLLPYVMWALIGAGLIYAIIIEPRVSVSNPLCWVLFLVILLLAFAYPLIQVAFSRPYRRVERELRDSGYAITKSPPLQNAERFREWCLEQGIQPKEVWGSSS